MTFSSDASAILLSWTGLSLDSIIEFLQDSIALFVGTAIYSIESMFPWILAVFAISAIVGFIVRGFMFFRT